MNPSYADGIALEQICLGVYGVFKLFLLINSRQKNSDTKNWDMARHNLAEKGFEKIDRLDHYSLKYSASN